MVNPRIASGTVIARRFAIESVAGSGGMGVVYRAVDLHADEPVALKVLQRGAAPGLEVERFGREVHALADLRHPAIVRYVGHGLTDEGAPFLAMEWLEGEDLARRLRRQRLDLAEAHTLAIRIAEALAAAHRQGLIHRDIKPQNIFLREGMIGRATLLDFGIARRIRDQRVLTATGTLLGTPEYMAPEQARGQGDIGPAVDVFSLGCVLFECLAGRSPFIGDHMTAVLAKILFDEPARLVDLRPEVPAAFAELIEGMLVKDPAARLGDGEAVHAALAGLAPLPASAPATGGGRISVALDRGALGDDEQWFVSVVVASEATVLGERITLDPREPHSGRWSALALHSFGAQVEELADGSIVATVTPSPGLTPADQAVLAARCALLVHDRLPDRVVAVATGRRVLTDPLPRGESIDRAVALLRIAAPTVRADALTARLLGARFELTRSDGDEQVFLVHGERITFDESQPLLGRPTPCLGREQELGAIEATLAACVDDGVARVVLVRGSPGMGKSRLRHEFLRRTRARGDDLVILQGRADLMQAGAAYAILRDALRQHCGLLPGEDPATQEARVRARLGAGLPGDEGERVCEFLGELCGVTIGDASPRLRAARRDPKLMHEQQSAAFIAFLRARARERPLLLVLDDLHWGDAPSLTLLDRALRELSELPLMLLAFARPEIDELVRDLWRERGIQELHLGRLGKRASERLVRHVLGADVDPALCARLVEQAAGNALYLEELIRAAADGKSDTLPDTVLAMLLVRLQRLDPAARRLLRAASCFGETFWRGGALAILHSETSTQEPDAWLPLLVEQEILVRHPQSRIEGEVEYAFRHPLVREAAYSLLSAEDRIRAHYRAADFLERAGEVDPRILAEHWHRAGEAERAAPYDLQAAEEAYAASDHPGALRHAERGLQSGADGELRGGLLALAGWVHAWRLETARAAELSEEAAALARPGGLWWCVAMTFLLHTTCYGDDVARFTELSERYIDTTPEPAAETTYVMGAANLVSLHGLRGSRELARAALWRADEIAARHLDDSGAQGWRELARSDYHRAINPDPQRHLAGMLAARGHFARSHERRNEFFAALMIGQAEAESGLLAEGEASLREGVRAAKELAEGFFVNMADIHLAAALAQRREPALLEEACALARALLTREGVGAGYRAWCHAILAEALVRLGAIEAAAEHSDAARSAPSTNVLRLRLAAATRLDVLRARGDLEAARALADAELAWVAAAGGAGYAELPLRLAAAEVYRATGDHARARGEIAAARAELLARADRISDPEWRARYLAEVPTHARIAALLEGEDPAGPA